MKPATHPRPSILHCRLSAALLGLSVITACAPAPGRSPDLLLVSIDTLRGDRWGCQGDPTARTPVADRLARRGLLIAEGRAPTPVTLPSHTTLMTGLPPVVHGVRDNGIFQLQPGVGRTLAEALHDAGWTTAAFVSSFPLMSRFGLDRGFDRYDDILRGSDATDGHLRQRPADATVDAVITWLGSPRAPSESRPLFLWTHFFDPHAEYRAPAPWNGLPGGPYGAEVAFTDTQLGRLIRTLERVRPNEWHIMVVADHGEGLGDHGELTHGVLANLSTLRIPMILSPAPGTSHLRTDPIPLAAVPATLLAAGGLPPELNVGSAPGVDEPHPVVHGETLYPFYNFGWSGLRVREENGWRLIAGPTDRLYRPAEDPGERRDVAAEYPEIVAELRAALEEDWENWSTIAWGVQTRELSEDELAALHAIGYLGQVVGEGSADDAFDRGQDPTGRVEWVTRLNAAITRLGHDDAVGAVHELREVLSEDPRNRLALEYLGRAYLQLGQPVRARRALRKALEVGRNPVRVHLDLAVVERDLGNREGQWEALWAALRVDPESVPARQAICVVLLLEGRPAEALPIMQGALDTRPRAPGVHFYLARIHEDLGNSVRARSHWESVLDYGATGALAQRAREFLNRSEGEGSR